MNLDLREAMYVANRYCQKVGGSWFDKPVIERDRYWFFPIGYIGSIGLIVEKFTGHVRVLGSALKLDDCFWGVENGLIGKVDLTINKVNSEKENVEEWLFILICRLDLPKNFRSLDLQTRRSLKKDCKEKSQSIVQCPPYTFHGVGLFLDIPWLRWAKENKVLEYLVEEVELIT